MMTPDPTIHVPGKAVCTLSTGDRCNPKTLQKCQYVSSTLDPKYTALIALFSAGSFTLGKSPTCGEDTEADLGRANRDPGLQPNPGAR